MRETLLPGAVKGPPRFNDFGWDFGGPIKRGKLFFFAGEEWKRIRRFANAATRTLPTSAEISGDFSALLALPAPIQLHMPGQPNVPIPGNNVASLITTDGKAIGAVYAAMRQEATSVADKATSSNGIFQPTNPFDWREEYLPNTGGSRELGDRAVNNRAFYFYRGLEKGKSKKQI
jgi:hypothetical protein